jgi:hypothetical protein
VDRRLRKTPSQLTKLSNAPEWHSIPDLNNALCGGPPGLFLMLQVSVRLATLKVLDHVMGSAIRVVLRTER